MPIMQSTEFLDLTEVTFLPDLTLEQLAIAAINDDPADFLRGMIVYKIEPIPSERPGAASSLKHELKYSLRRKVPGVWLADYAEGEGFAAGIAAGIECPMRTQLGKYTVARIEKSRDSGSLRDKILGMIAGVLVESKDAVVDLSNTIAFACGFKQVQETEVQGMRP